MVLVNLAVSIPLTVPVSIWGKMRESVGGGIRFFSPFGPIALAYGFKLDQRTGESSGEFHFSAGNAF